VAPARERLSRLAEQVGVGVPVAGSVSRLESHEWRRTADEVTARVEDELARR
jgi:hypothetical protein